MRLARLLAVTGLATSNKDGRRKIEQGGVRLAGEKVTDPDLEVDADDVDGRLLSVGKRAWARVVRGLTPAASSERVEDDQARRSRRRG